MKDEQLEKEFITTITQNEKIIYKVCSMYISDDFSMGDLYQECMYNLWKGFPKFNKNSAESTWIYRVTLNTCVSALRKKKKNANQIGLSVLENILHEPQEMDDNIKEMYRLIYQLKHLERAIVLLYLEEKSYQEIADITGITAVNVASRLKRIKLKLKEMSQQ